MTNAEKVKEVCRIIRGIALDYPDGLLTIRAELDSIDRATDRNRQWRQDREAALTPSEPPTASPTTLPPPNSAVQPLKRGPGRPRKIQQG